MITKTTLLIVLVVFACSLFAADHPSGSFGLGLGIPYGMMGVNFDSYLNQYVALTAGVGSTPIDRIGYAVGAKYYLTDNDKCFRPRLTALAGINGTLKKDVLKSDAKSATDEKTIYESYPGVSLGLGTLVTWGAHKNQGVDFDVFYISSSGVYSRISELRSKGYDIKIPDRVCVSFGYRYQF